MTEANGIELDAAPNLREAMIELIKIVEGFYACGVAASVYGRRDAAGGVGPDPVFANIGKLLLAPQIYDMHRLARHVFRGVGGTPPPPAQEPNPRPPRPPSG